MVAVAEMSENGLADGGRGWPSNLGVSESRKASELDGTFATIQADVDCPARAGAARSIASDVLGAILSRRLRISMGIS